MALCLNIASILKDKEIRGVHWAATTFFTTWGIWNLWYYPSLGQWASFAGGVAIVIANTVWLALVLRYRRA